MDDGFEVVLNRIDLQLGLFILEEGVVKQGWLWN